MDWVEIHSVPSFIVFFFVPRTTFFTRFIDGRIGRGHFICAWPAMSLRQKYRVLLACFGGVLMVFFYGVTGIVICCAGNDPRRAFFGDERLMADKVKIMGRRSPA
nr:hypothetical protein [uncultured Desulfuromonas sp.]